MKKFIKFLLYAILLSSHILKWKPQKKHRKYQQQQLQEKIVERGETVPKLSNILDMKERESQKDGAETGTFLWFLRRSRSPS